MSKVALVTGATNGIGKAIAKKLFDEGYEVIGFDLAENSSKNVRSVQGNVASERDVIALFSTIGRLGVVVNCAGIQLIKPLLETSEKEFDDVVGVNLKGTFLVGREAARKMLAQRDGGKIINIASELAYLGRAKYSAYCATKGAILSLTRSWARELAPKIPVNAVAPGPTDTQMVSKECMTEHEMNDELASLPLGRIAKPEEIADCVAFLASDRANYFTGHCLSPNGGAVMF